MEIPLDAVIDDSGWLGPEDGGDLLEAIDELVEEWELGGDAARWTPAAE